MSCRHTHFILPVVFMLHHVKNCVTACKISGGGWHEWLIPFLTLVEFMFFSTSLSTTSRNRLQFQVFFSSLAQMAHLCLEIRNCEITARVELLLFLHFSFYIIVIMAHGNINYNNNNNSSDDPAVLLSTL